MNSALKGEEGEREAMVKRGDGPFSDNRRLVAGDEEKSGSVNLGK